MHYNIMHSLLKEHLKKLNKIVISDNFLIQKIALRTIYRAASCRSQFYDVSHSDNILLRPREDSINHESVVTSHFICPCEHGSAVKQVPLGCRQARSGELFRKSPPDRLFDILPVHDPDGNGNENKDKNCTADERRPDTDRS